jgi:hypothetical protein
LIGIENFDKKIQPLTETGCWIWTAATNGRGYGCFWYEGKARGAHRVAWKVRHGRYPETDLDHLCRVTLCVNPDHLEVVSHRENVMRGSGPSAANAKKTHCPKGHPYDDANTIVYRGYRYCRTCT